MRKCAELCQIVPPMSYGVKLCQPVPHCAALCRIVRNCAKYGDVCGVGRIVPNCPNGAELCQMMSNSAELWQIVPIVLHCAQLSRVVPNCAEFAKLCLGPQECPWSWGRDKEIEAQNIGDVYRPAAGEYGGRKSPLPRHPKRSPFTTMAATEVESYV